MEGLKRKKSEVEWPFQNGDCPNSYYCLFCCAAISSSTSSCSNGEGESFNGSYLKRARLSDVGVEVTGGQGIEELVNRLEQMFILLKVLDVPKDLCEDLISRQDGDDKGPTRWFDVCRICTESYVKKAWDIHQELVAVQCKQALLQEKIKERMRRCIRRARIFGRRRGISGVSRGLWEQGDRRIDEEIKRLLFPDLFELTEEDEFADEHFYNLPVQIEEDCSDMVDPEEEGEGEEEGLAVIRIVEFGSIVENDEEEDEDQGEVAEENNGVDVQVPGTSRNFSVIAVNGDPVRRRSPEGFGSRGGGGGGGRRVWVGGSRPGPKSSKGGQCQGVVWRDHVPGAGPEPTSRRGGRGGKWVGGSRPGPASSKRKQLIMCSQCDSRFRRLEAYNAHMTAHEEVGIDGEFICTRCRYPARTLEELRIHEGRRHPEEVQVVEERTVTVNDNGNGNGESLGLGEQQRESEGYQQEQDLLGEGQDLVEFVVGGDEEENGGNVEENGGDDGQGQEEEFRCNLCNRTFRSLRGLRIHSSSHQEEFRCRSCRRGFPTPELLEEHEASHRRHECSYCQKRFVNSGNLKAHERTHTGERPYKCQDCPKSFKQLSGLQYHFKANPSHRPQRY